MSQSGYFRKFLRDAGGSVLPLTAIVLPVVLGMAGLGLDVSMWAMERRNLQTAADAAVMAAAWEIAYGHDDNSYDAAFKEAQNNGYNPDANGNFDLEVGQDGQGRTTVTATVSQASNTYLSNLVYHGDIETAVIAAAVIQEPTGDFCMLSLSPDASGAMTFNGNITIDSEGCGLAVNSTHPTAALNVNGNASDITVGDVAVVGGIDGEEAITAPSIRTGVSPFIDPYADLEVPDFEPCSKNDVKKPVEYTVAEDLPDANAQGVTVICGGMLVKNGVTPPALPPGVYIIDGGDFDIKGTLSGTGVTIILTNSGEGTYGDMKITGDLNITAPKPDELNPDLADFEGVAVFQDRNAPPTTNQCNNLRGNAEVVIRGAAYFPTRCLDIGGTPSASGDNNCSRIIAQTIRIHGDPNMANACEGEAVEDIGYMRVRLIL